MTNTSYHLDAGSNHPMDEIEYKIYVLVYSRGACEQKLREKGAEYIRHLYQELYPEEIE